MVSFARIQKDCYHREQCFHSVEDIGNCELHLRLQEYRCSNHPQKNWCSLTGPKLIIRSPSTTIDFSRFFFSFCFGQIFALIASSAAL